MNKNPKGFVQLFLILIIVIVGIGATGYYVRIGYFSRNSLRKICISSGGSWLIKYRECESFATNKGIDQEKCEASGGIFYDCRSPCRHDPEYPNVICPANCMKICQF